MKYRLIALDVDGTLLDDHHRLSELNKQTIARIHDQGVVFVLCTGRGPGNAIPIMERLGLQGVLISHNGAATVHSRAGEVIHQYAFSLEAVKPLVEYCRRRGVHFDVCTPYELYIERLEQPERDMYEQFMIEPVRCQNVMAIGRPVVKLTVFGDKERIDRVARDWDSDYFPAPGLRMIRSGEQFIDVMHEEASKGNALRRLALSLGIQREAVLAVGNYYNDIDMLEYAGLGVAMDNSPDEVKRVADAVTASNNEDGVHHALLRYVVMNTI